MNPGGTPIIEGTLYKALKTPFYAHSSPNYPWKVRSVTQKTPCVLNFWSKVTNVTQWPQCFWFFDKIFQVCSKYTKLFTNFHPNLWQNTFCLEYLERPHFLCKVSLLTRRPFFLRFLPHRMPLTLKIGTVLPFLFYIVVPPGI